MMLQTKNNQTPESTRALAKRPESIPGGAEARLTRNKQSSPLFLDSVRGHKPPVTPPPLTSARPTVDSQQETGQDQRTKEKGGGGRGVCGSVDHIFLVAREERCKTQEIAGETKTQNTTPTRPRTMGKTPGKHGKGTQPTQRKEEPPRRGRGKTRQGEPHPPRRKKESATRPRRTDEKETKSLGEPRLERLGASC